MALGPQEQHRQLVNTTQIEKLEQMIDKEIKNSEEQPVVLLIGLNDVTPTTANHLQMMYEKAGWRVQMDYVDNHLGGIKLYLNFEDIQDPE